MKRVETACIGAMTTGSGKTTFTLGLLSLLQKKGTVSSFKIGPDFIDPLFHRAILEQHQHSMFSRTGDKPVLYNLDSFFEEPLALKKMFSSGVDNSDFVIIEGVMGHLDGVIQSKASTDEVAAIIQAPVVLLVREIPSVSTLAAMIEGVIRNAASNIRSIVITCSTSEKLFQMQKKAIETLTGITVAGRLPFDKQLIIPSRHLGLDTDVLKLQSSLQQLAEKCGQLILRHVDVQACFSDVEITKTNESEIKPVKTAAVSQDEAFCFLYQTNVEWLEKQGYTIEYFSPLHDKHLPKAEFYYFCGGYPEIYRKSLAINQSMLKDVYKVCLSPIPVLAECGGYMYLHEQIEDCKMVGFLKGHAKIANRMQGHFGYEYLTLPDDFLVKGANRLKGHEFHYAYIQDGERETGIQVVKASNNQHFTSGIYKNNTLGSFAHLYFHSFLETEGA
ncbi:MAG: cobyrinate a,c-diamide synthase [Thermotogota bacterium]|nr:cobyrinate a,c-diamide synthase [Thermotogota bacterium]